MSTIPKSLPTYDVIIVGSGAGGGITAQKLSEKGLKVALIEMGPGKRTKDFILDEGVAYESLYQEAAGRKTADGAITILQGRTLGGGTTVNWTSSFRTPEVTLKTWKDRYGLTEAVPEVMEGYFAEAEKLISVSEWDVEPNMNNLLLEEGLKKLGFDSARIRRNVSGCQNLGFCGFGCPVGAKQSALVTTIPKAEAKGADVFCDAFAYKLLIQRDVVQSLVVVGRENSKNRLILKAKKFILSAGAIGTPALLKRSQSPDPSKILGKRTFIHPVVISGAIYEDKVEPYYGAPQTVYSDHFMVKELEEKRPGFKLEVPPIHPVLIGTSLPFYGKTHREMMESLPHLQAIIALQRDGFHEQSKGGEVIINSSGLPVLNYETTSYMQEGFRAALERMGEIQFAAGAKEVMPLHKSAYRCRNFSEYKKLVKDLSMSPHALKVVSAHVMGGAPMSNDKKRGVVDEHGKHHHLENVWVVDGSVFPTSVGTNPMVSILAQALRIIRRFSETQ